MTTPNEEFAKIVKAGCMSAPMGRRECTYPACICGKEFPAAIRGAVEYILSREPSEEMCVAGCNHENLGDIAGRFTAMREQEKKEILPNE